MTIQCMGFTTTLQPNGVSGQKGHKNYKAVQQSIALTSTVSILSFNVSPFGGHTIAIAGERKC